MSGKRYHVTTFGCQMNEHDSERMKGMLESLGYAPAAERADADLILFNTCSIRESADNRFIAHLGEAKRLKSENPERVVGVGGCWAQSVKDEVFERFPFVDVAFGPGQIARLAEFLTSDSLSAQGYFEFEDFAGHLPMQREREFQAWVQISQGCNCGCSYCIVPSTRGREQSRDPVELVAEVERLAADGVREVTLLGQNVNSYGRDLRASAGSSFAELLARVDAVDGIERIRYTSPHPKDMREDVIRAHAELRVALRAHPPAAAVGLEPDPEGDAAHLRPRALPRPGRADPRARARLRADHRHHRRLPGRDRGRLRADARGRRAGRLRRRLHVRLLARAAGPRRPTLDDQVPHPVKRERMERLVEAGPAARPRARPAVRRPHGWRSWSRARAAPTLLGCAAAARHNKTVNFDGTAAAGELVEVEIEAATSQTLTGHERLLSRAT